MKAIMLSYKTIGGFEFSQLMAKLNNTNTDNRKASHIYQVAKRVKAGSQKITDEYKTEIMEKFGKKGADGKVVSDQNANGGFQMDEAVGEDFNKAFKEFEDRQIEVDWRPLTPDVLSDVKLSANEIGLLGPLYTEESGPGVPHLQTV